MPNNIPTEAQELTPDLCIEVVRSGDQVILTTNNQVRLVIEVYTDHVIRLRFLTGIQAASDFSYALPTNGIRGYNELSVEESDEKVVVRTLALSCYIQKKGLTATFYDKSGKLLNQDEKGFHWQANQEAGGNVVRMSKYAQKGEHFYGLGDKTGHFNLRDKRYEMWGSDIYGFDNYSDPLYKCIPFYIGRHHNRCYGLFYDNTFRSYFDFASERKNTVEYQADGGEMNYYFIVGSTMLKIVERYTRLTGTAPLPPLWALGYHQCKWSYYPESQVREICNKLRSLNIPCDAIYLDIDYMDGFRCFTWDKNKFPDPKKMVKDLENDGFKTIVIIDPGIKVDMEYSVFREALEKDYFCKRADGDYFVGKVWPGECYFPDFTNPIVRSWWADLFEHLIDDIGVHGVWNDMNEPAVFEVENKTFPNDVRHSYDGHYCSHRKAHNIYGMQMTRATYHGVKKFAHPRRPFIITRSCYSGIQRYSSVWTGDNKASWEHLRIAHLQVLRLNISGVSFAGSDIGGFIDHPTAELYIRWIQLATFHPFMRTHSSGDHGNQEPWSFGENALKIVREFIQLRYSLLDYLYTAFDQYTSHGTPILRPISFVDLHDDETHYREDEFLFGDHILVCPILDNHLGRYLYLPKGEWYDFWTGEVHTGQNGELHKNCGLEKIPLYIRAGAVIPIRPMMNYVGEEKINQLTLRIFYSESAVESQLFVDRGDGYDYKRGYYLRSTFTTQGGLKKWKILQYTSGSYIPDYQTYRIELNYLPYEPKFIDVDGERIEWTLENKTIVFYAPLLFRDIELIG